MIDTYTSVQKTSVQEAPYPVALAEVALVNAKTSAAVGGMSESWWHEEVRAGRAPQPAVRAPRCTRWRLADVRQFWVDFTHRDHEAAAARIDATVRKAGRAAKAARQAKLEAGGH